MRFRPYTVNHWKIMIAIAGALLAAMVLACDDSAPQSHTFALSLQGGNLAEEPNLVVNAGDTVTLRWLTDQESAVHLHGYDLEAELTPDMPQEITFTAHATGRFNITLHTGAAGQRHGHGEGGCATALPPNEAAPAVEVHAVPSQTEGNVKVAIELTNFELGQDAGHWRLEVDGVDRGMYFRPGATVPVQDSGDHHVQVTLADADHCEYDITATTTVTLANPSGDDHTAETTGHTPAGEAGAAEADERIIATLEVRP